MMCVKILTDEEFTGIANTPSERDRKLIAAVAAVNQLLMNAAASCGFTKGPAKGLNIFCSTGDWAFSDASVRRELRRRCRVAGWKLELGRVKVVRGGFEVEDEHRVRILSLHRIR